MKKFIYVLLFLILTTSFAFAAEPASLPEWDTSESNTVDPGASRKLSGWQVVSGIPEKPSFRIFNHWMNNVYKWVDYFKSNFAVPVDNIADLRAITYTPVDGQVVNVLGYYAKAENRNWTYKWKSTSTDADNGGTIIKITALTTGRFEFLYTGAIDAVAFGAVADGTTDNYNAIEAALTVARASAGHVYFSDRGYYNYSQTLYFGASRVIISGNTQGVFLRYTGTGTGIALDSDPVTNNQREECQLRDVNLVSSTGSKGFDITGGSYCSHTNFTINYTATDAVLLYGEGAGGKGPYYNVIDKFFLIGGGDESQIGIGFYGQSGVPGFGPNANIITNLKRATSLKRAMDIKVGNGNLITNISGELINDAMIVLNDLDSAEETGTATSSGATSLIDSTKTWAVNQYINMALVLTSGTYSGESRRIVSNTTTTINTLLPWPDDIGTPTYEIYAVEATGNKIVNVRQEGRSSDNPDCVRIMPGAWLNEVSNIQADSKGTGKTNNDLYGDPSNVVRQGDQQTETFVIEDAGAIANIEVIPRNSVFGGLQSGSNMVLEYIHIASPNFVAGEAVLTVDQGGTAAGNGTNTVIAKINSVTSKEAYAYNDSKELIASTSPIFINLTTDASVSAGADFIITVTYQVY